MPGRSVSIPSVRPEIRNLGLVIGAHFAIDAAKGLRFLKAFGVLGARNVGRRIGAKLIGIADCEWCHSTPPWKRWLFELRRSGKPEAFVRRFIGVAERGCITTSPIQE